MKENREGTFGILQKFKTLHLIQKHEFSPVKTAEKLLSSAFKDYFFFFFIVHIYIPPSLMHAFIFPW